MRRTPSRILLLLLLLISLVLPARAAAPDLSGLVSGSRRWYAQGLIAWHLQYNEAVQKTLHDGYTALFFLEGLSNNMDISSLSDLGYYRVSALCIGVCLNDQGQPELICFNEDASTLPDRPLDFDSWELDSVGLVGPATVLDGTYEVYSVYHGGYEALQLRSTYEDETILALYMIPEGFEEHRAFAINIHTRTDNHILKNQMWSAGCLLVGDGDYEEFRTLVDSVYYPHYQTFQRDRYVGTVTIHRYPIRQQMEKLYKSASAVDWILGSSVTESPEHYGKNCIILDSPAQSRTMEIQEKTALWSLPCDHQTDVRSVAVTTLEPGDRVETWNVVENPEGQCWYEVRFPDGNCYLRSDHAAERSASWLRTLWNYLFG